MSEASASGGPNLSFSFRDTPVVMPCFGIVMFTGESFSAHAAAVLDAFDAFERLCPRSELTFYRTETMSQRKPVTPGTFGLLKTWLKPGAARREYVALDISGGASWAATSDINFSVFGRERDALTYESGKANWLRITVPLGRMSDELEVLDREAMRLFASMPFISGHAGPILELSLYYREESQRFAWKTVMRYRGFDFCDPAADCAAVGQDGLRSISWLTLLGSALALDLGGAKSLAPRLSKAVELRELPNGLCLKAGPRPELGDRYAGERLVNYESVFRACEPAIDRMAKRYSPMMLEADRRENTTKLMRRLAYEDE